MSCSAELKLASLCLQDNYRHVRDDAIVNLFNQPGENSLNGTKLYWYCTERSHGVSLCIQSTAFYSSLGFQFTVIGL